MSNLHKPLGVAVIGAGYWGPNLIRNFLSSEQSELLWVCDLDEERARKVVGRNSGVRVTPHLDDVLNDPAVEAVAIATPAGTHLNVGLKCLEAGRHILVEKPLASTVADGERLVAEAERRGLQIMCDHTYCYTPAVSHIRTLVEKGELGDIQYVDSTRVNLGLVQRDIDVLWDLGPHDLSILDFVLPADRRPTAVAAHGADPIGAGLACIGYMTMPLEGGGIAHVSVNWLSPTKIRTMIVCGSRRMLVWDDLNPTQRISLYDKGVDLTSALQGETRRDALISYRVGDMVAPALPEYEALGGVVNEFATAIRTDTAPLTDGHAGLRVLRVLEAASTSLRQQGASVSLNGLSNTDPEVIDA